MGNPGLGAAFVSQDHLPEDFSLIAWPAWPAWKIVVEKFDEVPGSEHGNVRHPLWKILGFPPTSRELHNELWKQAAQPAFARRRIYDSRTALSLRAFGVTDFATANEKDFQDFGFQKVWNPLALPGSTL